MLFSDRGPGLLGEVRWELYCMTGRDPAPFLSLAYLVDRLAEYNVPWPGAEAGVGLVDRTIHERTIVDVARLILKSRVPTPAPLRIHWAANADPTKGERVR